MKSAFVAIIGRPNAGKSSIINRLVGEKVSIVSPKPQTTRDKIMGILTENDWQLIFTDTPGIHAPKNKLDVYMQKCVRQAEEGVDAVLMVIDASKGVSRNELDTLAQCLENHNEVYVAVNKIDIVKKEEVFSVLQKISDVGGGASLKEVIPISAKTGTNIEELKTALKRSLKEGAMYFPKDEYTDKPVRFIIAEIIREKALMYLQDEIPHGIGVYIQHVDDGDVFSVEADIICEKESHKPIIIGTRGAMLKKIGCAARLDIVRLLNKKVYLKLFVKVREDWRNSSNYIRDIGYEK